MLVGAVPSPAVWPSCGLALSRELFDELQGFDPMVSPGEELDLWLRAQLGVHRTATAVAIQPAHGAHPRLGRVKREVRQSRASVLLSWKYRRLPLVRASQRDFQGGVSGPPRRLGRALGWLDLTLGRRWASPPLQLGSSTGMIALAAIPKKAASNRKT